MKPNDVFVTVVKTLPSLVASLPQGMSPLLEQLGDVWGRAPERPRIAESVRVAWDAMIEGWIESDLPLIVRKASGVRGAELRHETGRRLVVSDNSPAQWAFARAFEGATYDVDGVRLLLERDEIPVALATKSAEKSMMKYKRTLTARDNVNQRGWKLCHIESVGLSTRVPLEVISLEQLHGHFRRFLAPSNHFLVPLRWGGLGEVPEFIAAMRQVGA
jgi:hypothetical protein